MPAAALLCLALLLAPAATGATATPRAPSPAAGSFLTTAPDAGGGRAALVALLAAERRLDPAARREAGWDLPAAAAAYLARRAGGVSAPERAQRALSALDRAATAPPLALALAELRLVAELGGWVRVDTLPGPAPTAPPPRLVSPEIDVAPSFPPRKRLPELGSLRRRLVQSADLSATYLTGGSLMDVHTANAVRRFQARHGLAADGVVGPRTLAALNAPVAGEVARARVNLARGLDDRAALPRYVEVNVPGFELRLVEGGRVTLRSRVIVGDRKNATPIFDDLMRTIEINPSWYVPRSIEAELTEKETKRPGYLAGNGFYWWTPTHGGPDRLVQRPGPENALGRVKFLFPNHHAVYLHDTPRRGLFGRSQRSLSHGCIRVEKPFDLALALLRGQGWDADRLRAAYAGTRTRRVELTSHVPVFLDYRTAYVDEQGRLQLRPDLYGHDAAGVTRFDGKGLPAAGPPEPPASPLARPTLPDATGRPAPAAFLAAQ